MLPIDVMFKNNAGGGGIFIYVESGTWQHYVLDPSNAYCAIQFNSNGTCSTSADVSPGTPSPWKTGGGAGADYDISFDGGGAWVNLGSNQLISVSRSVIGTSSGTFDVRIRPAGGGATLASGSMTLEAIVDA